jgi:vanillate/3-O-methylgallate O-demethylase
VLDSDGDIIGLSTYPGYSVNERAMLSLGSLDDAYSEPGTEVALVWGEEEGGSKSTPWIEPHIQVEIRATVAPVPISDAAQSYRSVVKRT